MRAAHPSHRLDDACTGPYRLAVQAHSTIKAHQAKAGAAKPRVLASSATPSADATKDPKTAELPKGGSAFVVCT
jgi:hypothetical protein